MNRTLSTGRAVGIIGVVAIVLLGIAAYGLVVIDTPRIQSVDNSWGTVTAEQTEIESEIQVENPLLVRVGDAAADVRYTVALNGITVATEREQEVSLGGQEDVIMVSTWMDNSEIPDWWVTHINRNETTTVTVDPEVVAQYGDLDVPADSLTRQRTVQTNLLDPLETDRERQFSAFGRPVLVVEETNAQWGQATTERTPINTSATVENQLPVPLPISEIQYTIRMNGIVVGAGTTGDRIVIPAEGSRQITTRAEIDNSKLDEWWVTHLRNNETTEFSIEFNATVEYGGLERQLPLEFLTYNRTVQTDMLDTEQSETNAT